MGLEYLLGQAEISGPTIFVIALVVILVLLLIAAIKIVQEFERGVIFRLGRVIAGAKGPGLFFIIPIIDKMVKVNLQTVTVNVPAQEVITRDNVTVRVDAVAYFNVVEPVKSVVNVQNYMFATSQVCQTTLRNVCGTAELDEVLAERDRLNASLQEQIDEATEPWGVKVTRVEIRDVQLGSDIQRAMARQAEAERDRRARIINAEGEQQAAEKLNEAARIIGQTSIGYQMRLLQTLNAVAAENNSTLVIPVPIELLGRGLAEAVGGAADGDGTAERPSPGDVQTPAAGGDQSGPHGGGRSEPEPPGAPGVTPP